MLWIKKKITYCTKWTKCQTFIFILYFAYSFAFCYCFTSCVKFHDKDSPSCSPLLFILVFSFLYCISLFCHAFFLPFLPFPFPTFSFSLPFFSPFYPPFSFFSPFFFPFPFFFLFLSLSYFPYFANTSPEKAPGWAERPPGPWSRHCAVYHINSLSLPPEGLPREGHPPEGLPPEGLPEKVYFRSQILVRTSIERYQYVPVSVDTSAKTCTSIGRY